MQSATVLPTESLNARMVRSGDPYLLQHMHLISLHVGMVGIKTTMENSETQRALATASVLCLYVSRRICHLTATSRFVMQALRLRTNTNTGMAGCKTEANKVVSPGSRKQFCCWSPERGILTLPATCCKCLVSKD